MRSKTGSYTNTVVQAARCDGRFEWLEMAYAAVCMQKANMPNGVYTASDLGPLQCTYVTLTWSGPEG
jgi:hypothetical protein